MTEILLYGVVGEDFDAAWLDARLRDADGDDVLLRVNSPGGDVFEGVAIASSIGHARSRGARVEAVVDGLAASAASYMCSTADRIAMRPGSQAMVHNPSCVAVGEADYLRSQADALDKCAASIRELLCARTGRDDAEVADAMGAETWFGAREAVEWGLADEVADDGHGPDAMEVNRRWAAQDCIPERMAGSALMASALSHIDNDRRGPDGGPTGNPAVREPGRSIDDDADGVPDGAGAAPSEGMGEAPRLACLGGRIYEIGPEERA